MSVLGCVGQPHPAPARLGGGKRKEMKEVKNGYEGREGDEEDLEVAIFYLNTKRRQSSEISHLVSVDPFGPE